MPRTHEGRNRTLGSSWRRFTEPFESTTLPGANLPRRPGALRRLRWEFLRLLSEDVGAGDVAPLDKEAKSPHLLPLTQTVGQMVLPIQSTADHQATIRAAEAFRRDDNIDDFVTLSAVHRQKVVFPLQPPQGGVRSPSVSSAKTQPSPMRYLTSFANTTNGVFPLPFFTFPRSSSSSSRTSWMKPSSSRVLRTWEMNRAYLR
jgi:hypothetical protein